MSPHISSAMNGVADWIRLGSLLGLALISIVLTRIRLCGERLRRAEVRAGRGVGSIFSPEVTLKRIGWISGRQELPSDELGAAVLGALVGGHNWIHRRVETIRFVEELRFQRHISIDFSLPALHDGKTSKDMPQLVPLALLRKGPVLRFDLRDEGDGSLPVLRSADTNFVAWSVLAHAAKNINASVPSPLLKDLKLVVSSEADRARAVLKYMQSEKYADSKIMKQLMHNPVFSDLASSFARCFTLLTVVSFEPARRRILKYSYDQDIRFPDRRSVAHWLGWKPDGFDIFPGGVAHSASYHLEVQSLGGLQFAGIEPKDTGLLNYRTRFAPSTAHLHFEGAWGPL